MASAPLQPGSHTVLRRLQVLAAAGVLGFVAVLDLVRWELGPAVDWPGRILLDLLLLGGAGLGMALMFRVVERMQRRLERRNSELMALDSAAFYLYRELSLEAVLEKVVERARLLLGARYGALSVIDAEHRIESFVTSGISREERARLGAPPKGHGLLGVVLHEGQRLRIPDIDKDPRSVGFPPDHPHMRSLLAVPIQGDGSFRGNLYLADKVGAAEFSAEDEETLARFALMAALAIDNAHLHARLKSVAVSQERLRIAHEMHDGLAQVLAYVNTKAQAVREFLRSGRGEEAEKQLDQLAGAAREVYADVRESIIGLRAAAVPGRSLSEALAEHAAAWEAQSGMICDLVVEPDLHLPPETELQLVRIVHEALANVRKHARARRAEVRVGHRDGRVFATVEDDGVGFDPAAVGSDGGPPHFGIATMRERAASVGGAVEIVPRASHGTRVRIELPLPGTPHAAGTGPAS